MRILHVQTLAGVAALALSAASAGAQQTPGPGPGAPTPAPGNQPNMKTTSGTAAPSGSPASGSMTGGSMSGGSMSGGTMGGPRVTVPLTAQNGSGETGTATLTQAPNGLVVTLTMSTAPDSPQPAHIHKGSCAKLDPTPAYPLSSVTKATDAQGHATGTSTTTLTNVTLDALTKGQFAINVHKSATDIKTYVACGDIKNANPTGTSR